MGENISRPKQVTDWVARLEKLEQAPAAESDSGLLVQPAWIEKNVPDVCATNSLWSAENTGLPLSGSPPLAADRGWGGASAHREAEGRQIPASSRWVFTIVPGALRARALSLTTHWTGIPGAAWAAPDASSKSVAGVRGPASPVNKSLELVLRSRICRLDAPSR